MFGSMVNQNWSENLSDEEKKFMDQMVTTLGEEITAAARAMQLPVSKVNGTEASDVIAVLDQAHLHLVFERTSGAGSKFIMRSFPDKAISVTDIAAFGASEHGMDSASGVSFPRTLMTSQEDEKRDAVRNAAKNLVAQLKAAKDKPRALAGFEGLQPLLDAFSTDHPDYEKNVFVAMRFSDTQQNREIWASIEGALKRYGMKAHRADTKSYPQDDDLWSNVCVYMMGCKYGICVFDQIDERDFNPNVQIEYGFMRASNKRVLLLKDKRQPTMPVDITGKIRREFDTYNIAETVAAQVSNWAESDLGAKL